MFQGFEAELAGLPGKYARDTGGVLFVAREGAGTTGLGGADGEAGAAESAAKSGSDAAEPAPCVGCIALRKLEEGVCEVKRLYVRPAYRGNKLGQWLVSHIMRTAVDLGYKRVMLDSLERLPAAGRLYQSMGFRYVEAYCHNPLEDAVYMRWDVPTEAVDKAVPAPPQRLTAERA